MSWPWPAGRPVTAELGSSPAQVLEKLKWARLFASLKAGTQMVGGSPGGVACAQEHHPAPSVGSPCPGQQASTSGACGGCIPGSWWSQSQPLFSQRVKAEIGAG